MFVFVKIIDEDGVLVWGVVVVVICFGEVYVFGDWCGVYVVVMIEVWVV